MNENKVTTQPRARRPKVCAVALVLPLLVVGACGTDSGVRAPGDTGRPTDSPTGGGSPGTAPATPAPSTGTPGTGSATPRPSTSRPAAPSAARTVRTGVYFLHGEHVSAVPRTVTAPSTAAGAVRALLAGPGRYERAHDRTTAIPSGTALRSVAVRDRVATVDLSGRYDDGGGSLSMRARLAQVVFTVTRYPTIDKVRFALDGKPVTSFGGEGIVLEKPVGRADFEDLAPAVLVEAPMTGDTVRSPVRVWGSANTFEAEFRLKVTDASGRTATDVQVRATSGTGTRGSFDVTIPYRATRSGGGLLTAYYLSPEDGRPVTVDTVPLSVKR
ncbi:GerMN domain-containing protein [Streptomyces sp. NPDC005931]|uniref:GerMN domain-containing protein n=1 Tax=Streptomyces sp. NPDC005931 TaxID=3364737 RepID=UPI0036C9C392